MRTNAKRTRPRSKLEQVHEIVGSLMHRYATAIVLFHSAVAERLGLGETDLQCLDLLRERDAMTGSQLAELTSLTTGAITGVVTRLERSGYLRRDPHPSDGRKQRLRATIKRTRDIHHIFEPIRKDVAALVERFDSHQLAAISEFLREGSDLAYRHLSLLRGENLLRGQGLRDPGWHAPQQRR
jgi:DNA-binding MarR family transcriptional regulator